MFVLGVGCSAIYPTLLAYGMKLPGKVSPYTLSFLVTCGFFGGILSLAGSAVIGSFLPKIVPVVAGPFWCFFIILFLVLSRRLHKN